MYNVLCVITKNNNFKKFQGRMVDIVCLPKVGSPYCLVYDEKMYLMGKVEYDFETDDLIIFCVNGAVFVLRKEESDD